jgi:electron transfer flavoprotein beta subunit
VDSVYVPRKSKKTEILEGPAQEVAAKLVEKLKFEVRVI